MPKSSYVKPLPEAEEESSLLLFDVALTTKERYPQVESLRFWNLISTAPSFLESDFSGIDFAEEKIGFRIAVSRVQRSMDGGSSGSPVLEWSGQVWFVRKRWWEKCREAKDYLRLIGIRNRCEQSGKNKRKKNMPFIYLFIAATFFAFWLVN